MATIAVILIFDIGKTNKKSLVFDRQLNLLRCEEKTFEFFRDDDGHDGDNFDAIESWIDNYVKDIENCEQYTIFSINFATYGASLAFLDKEGRRICPVYDYLKVIPDHIPEQLFANNCGRARFCSQTGSPPMGMINSGAQILWLAECKPDIYARTQYVLHLPNYLAFRFSKKLAADFTSVGCHTMLWDFERQEYHGWTRSLGIKLPIPEPTTTLNKAADASFLVGTGIHDSSSSIVPYMNLSPEPFALISTGTWCVNMNPFNQKELTEHELENGCLHYLSIEKKPIKSSLIMLGRIHDECVQQLLRYFETSPETFAATAFTDKAVEDMLDSGNTDTVFFQAKENLSSIEDTLENNAFASLDAAYIQLMADLVRLLTESINLILDAEEPLRRLYIAGGFVKNELFTRLIATKFSQLGTYISELENSTALGAAIVANDDIEMNHLDLRLRIVKPYPFILH